MLAEEGKERRANCSLALHFFIFSTCVLLLMVLADEGRERESVASEVPKKTV